MGIKDLYKVIGDNCEDVLVEIDLSQLCGIKVTVDISIFLNKYVKSAGTKGWINSFIVFLCTLKKNGIKPVCIFDGPNPPKEKKSEQQRRRAEATKKAERIDRGRVLLKEVETKYVPTSKRLLDSLKEEIKLIIGVSRNKKSSVNYDDVHDVAACLNDALDKMTTQNLPILPEYSVMAKNLIEIMGFPSFQADGEAEALCASMCHLGLVDAVISEDTDVLAIGAPFLLSKIDVKKGKITAISYADVLSGMQMTSPEFRDLCILLSCDYNNRVKGFVPGSKRKTMECIGAKGAVQMINEYRRLEEAEKFMEDADPLNYRRCRELFTPLKELPGISIPYNRPVNRKLLEQFILKHRIHINIEYIMNMWAPVKLNFIHLASDEIEVIEDDTEDDPSDDVIDAEEDEYE